jgi:hypothetical protein
VGQVVAVTLDNYQRPIPTPVENLRPSQDTCEQCHWPHRFTGDPIKVVRRFSDDEANTPLTTVLLMHIGGGTREKGIHSWHIDSNKETVFATADRERKEVLWVEVRESGKVTRYVRDGAEESEAGRSLAETRVMDCVDCHNRPTHVYDLPATGLDEVLADGKVSQTIPFIKKAGVEILEEAAKRGSDPAEVGPMVQNRYQQEHPDFYGQNRQLVDQAAAEIQGIYAENVFPRMKVTWGTYPNHIGHQSYQDREDYPGCFRCHNGELSSSDGKTIDQDCSLCHTLLAWEEENPEVLSELGLE